MRWLIHASLQVQFNSLTPGKCVRNLKSIIIKFIIHDRNLGIHGEIALKWMPQNLTNEKSTLLQIMDWCRQVAIHYLSQCQHISMLPYGITMSQWGIITWYDGFLPPVRCISAPGTTLFGPVVCLHCFNFVNPPQISMKLRWVSSVY